MKLEWVNVAEIALGVFFAGLVLSAINALFYGFLAHHGSKIHGKDATGNDVPA